MAALFNGRGGPQHACCMMWRSQIDGTSVPSAAADRRTAMEKAAQADTPLGILVYDHGMPVAWCSVAPRDRFGKELTTPIPIRARRP